MDQFPPEAISIVSEIFVYSSAAFLDIFDTFTFPVTFSFAVICLSESHLF